MNIIDVYGKIYKNQSIQTPFLPKSQVKIVELGNDRIQLTEKEAFEYLATQAQVSKEEAGLIYSTIQLYKNADSLHEFKEAAEEGIRAGFKAISDDGATLAELVEFVQTTNKIVEAIIALGGKQ